MKKRFSLYLGLLLIVGGVIISLSSFLTITGLVLLEEAQAKTGSLVGIILIIAGILLVLSSRKKISVLESEAGVELNVTRPFEKAIRRYDARRIETALRKIGTGLGEEHKLKGGLKGKQSIRAGKGERIIFTYDREHRTATVEDYLPDHEYHRLQKE